MNSLRAFFEILMRLWQIVQFSVCSLFGLLIPSRWQKPKMAWWVTPYLVPNSTKLRVVSSRSFINRSFTLLSTPLLPINLNLSLSHKPQNVSHPPASSLRAGVANFIPKLVYQFWGKNQPKNRRGVFYGKDGRVNLRAGHVTLKNLSPTLIFSGKQKGDQSEGGLQLVPGQDIKWSETRRVWLDVLAFTIM